MLTATGHVTVEAHRIRTRVNIRDCRGVNLLTAQEVACYFALSCKRL